ncbi:MAG: Dabb family protein [Candidatus Bathyarchaeota archaeon]|nr:Dabb family protein [Candidatus Bathyarchaeota archaeon]
MLIHIVLIKFKEGTAESQIKELHENVLRLKEKIPGINSISGGSDVSTGARAHDFNYGFVMEFTDSKALDDYLPHPVHKSTVEKYIHPIASDVLVLDYNI